MVLIISQERSGYSPKQAGSTLTAGELVELLEEYDEDTPVYIGNDRTDYGWYTYGRLSFSEIEEFNEDDL